MTEAIEGGEEMKGKEKKIDRYIKKEWWLLSDFNIGKKNNFRRSYNLNART